MFGMCHIMPKTKLSFQHIISTCYNQSSKELNEFFVFVFLFLAHSVYQYGGHAKSCEFLLQENVSIVGKTAMHREDSTTHTSMDTY